MEQRGNGSKGLKRRRSCHGASERARLTRDGNAGEKEKTRVDEPNLLVEAESDVIRKMDLLSFFDSLSLSLYPLNPVDNKLSFPC